MNMRILSGLTAALLVWAVVVGPAPADAPAKAPTCNGDFGTSIFFEDSPKEAAAQALKEEKLVFILHVSGHFEDPALT
jgi:hypothetical protein